MLRQLEIHSYLIIYPQLAIPENSDVPMDSAYPAVPDVTEKQIVLTDQMKGIVVSGFSSLTCHSLIPKCSGLIRQALADKNKCC